MPTEPTLEYLTAEDPPPRPGYWASWSGRWAVGVAGMVDAIALVMPAGDGTIGLAMFAFVLCLVAAVAAVVALVLSGGRRGWVAIVLAVLAAVLAFDALGLGIRATMST